MTYEVHFVTLEFKDKIASPETYLRKRNGKICLEKNPFFDSCQTSLTENFTKTNRD